MQLVKYSCGCVGTSPGVDNKALIFRPCDPCQDDHTDGTHVFVRDMSAPTPDGKRAYKGLGEAEQGALIARLSQLVYLGHELENLRKLLAPISQQTHRLPTIQGH